MAEPERAEGGEPRLRDAAIRLYETLDALPDFEPCRGPAESWPADVRRRRLPVWDILPDFWQNTTHGPRKVKDAWFAFGEGMVVFWEPSRPVIGTMSPGISNGSQDPGDALARVKAAAATVIPPRIRESLVEGWQNLMRTRATARVEPEVIVQNAWHLRRLEVERVMPTIASCLQEAKRAVLRLRGDVQPIDALTNDDILHNETIDAALAQLRPLVEQAENPSVGATLAGGVPALMTGQQAAQCIGVSESMLPRWRKDVPAWASGNTVLFRHLMDRDGMHYHRHNMIKLAKWYAAAQSSGGQSPVDCP